MQPRIVPTEIVSKTKNIIVNKQTRSFVFLLISALIILAINALLPTIEGNTHYTADEISVTYGEYKELKEQDNHYVLTWSSEASIQEYKDSYISMHPELNAIEITRIEPPDEFIVKVYTKFFFQHVFWYMKTIVHVVSAVVLFYAVFNHLLVKLKLSYERYLDLTSDLTKLSNEDLDPITFEPWMDSRFNRDRKIRQHIENIKFLLNTLERRTSYRVRLDASNGIINKKTVRYLNKKQDLNAQLDHEYVNSVVPYKKVRFFKYIQPTFVTCGVNKVGRVTDSYSSLESDSTRLSKDAVQKVLISMLLTVMFASLLTMTVVTAADKPWYWVCIDILSTLAPLAIQIPLAYDYCASYMDEHLIPNLISRKSIALLYLARNTRKEEEYAQENIA